MDSTLRRIKGKGKNSYQVYTTNEKGERRFLGIQEEVDRAEAKLSAILDYELTEIEIKNIEVI